MLTTTPITTLGSLRILRALAEVTKTEARETRAPQVATEALDDTIDALTEAINVLERHPAAVPPLPPHGMFVDHVSMDRAALGTLDPNNLEAWRAEGARRRTAAPVTCCACDLWPLDDLDATQDDGITLHGFEACVSRGTIVAKRADGNVAAIAKGGEW